jgi:3-methyladenine DNA glycosylase/8-oxoguanine DNA glycosylase
MTTTTDTPRGKAAAVADPKARKFLRKADPVLARVIDAHPDFHPRAWIDELPPFDAFGTLAFQVIGQQLSVSATRTILARLQDRFGGHIAVAGGGPRRRPARAPRQWNVDA